MRAFLTILLLSIASVASAATLASNGSTSDVQSKINSAADGDIVTIPAGPFSWSSGVDIAGKGITLRGDGGGRARGSSTTSLAIGTGSKTFTVQAGLGFTAGEAIRAHYKASQAGNHMDGTVTSYSGTSLVLNITSVTGSGTYAAWSFQQDGSTILTCSGTDDIVDITEDSTHNVHVEDIHFIRTSGSAIVITIGGSGKPAIVENCRFDMSGGRTIEMGSIHGLVARCDFRVHGVTWSGTPNNSQAISMPSVSQASWAAASTMGTADTTGENNFYVEDCWFLGFYTETIDMDGGARIVLRTNYFDNTGLTSHGMDTGIYGIRYFEIYNNTFIHHNLSSSTAPLDYFYFIRGGTGVIASNTLPDMNTGEYGDKTEIKMTVMNLQRNGGPYPCYDDGYPAPRQIGFGRVTGAGSSDGNGYLGDSEPLYIYGNAGGYAVGLSDYGECGTHVTSTYVQAGRDYFNNNTVKPSYTFYTYPHPLRSGGGADTTDPTIAIDTPTSSATYSTAYGALTISGTASDDTAVTSVTWSNNRGGSGSATGTTSWSKVSIPLLLGVNIITITATDAAANDATDAITVTRTLASGTITSAAIGTLRVKP